MLGRFILTLSVLCCTALPAVAQTAITLPIAANAVADLGNGPIKVRMIAGNASIFTAQSSGTGSTSGSSTALTLTATPATPPLVGGLISGAGITSGTTVAAYNGTTGITLSAAVTVVGGTTVSWGAACPSSVGSAPVIQASAMAGYYVMYTQARVCAVSPGGPVNTLLIEPIFYDQTAPNGGVSGGVVNADTFFGSGRPWCDIRAWGAVQDGIWTGTGYTGTDDNGAWARCNTILTALGGGIIYVPPSTGRSCLKSGGITPGIGVVILGAGYGYGGGNSTPGPAPPAAASACGADNTVFNFANAFTGMSGMWVEGGIFGTTPTVIAHTSRVLIDSSTIIAGSPSLEVTGGCNDCIITRTDAQGSYAGNNANISANVYVSAGFFGYRDNFDTSWFGAPAFGTLNVGAIVARAANTAYAAGSIVTMTGPDGKSYYVKVPSGGGGTSGSGSQPTVQPYAQTFIDGTVTWRLLRPVGPGGNFADLQCDGCATLFLKDVDLSGAAIGLWITNTNSQIAQNNTASPATFGNNWGYGVLATAGWGLQLIGGYVNAGATTGFVGVQTTANWLSSLQISDMLMFNDPTAVSFGAGVNSSVKGSQIFNASAVAINVANNITDVNLSNNQLGADGVHGGNANSIILGTGTDYIVAGGNNCHGATAGLTNNGSGAHNYIPSGGNPGC